MAIDESAIRQPDAKPVVVERLYRHDAQHSPRILVQRSDLDEWFTKARAIPIIQQFILMESCPVDDQAHLLANRVGIDAEVELLGEVVRVRLPARAPVSSWLSGLLDTSAGPALVCG